MLVHESRPQSSLGDRVGILHSVDDAAQASRWSVIDQDQLDVGRPLVTFHAVEQRTQAVEICGRRTHRDDHGEHLISSANCSRTKRPSISTSLPDSQSV